MANWLDKALGRKDATTSVAVVPFDVRCECGSRLTGVRSERARRAICAQCGEAHFILPVNRYPESARSYFEQAPTDDNSSASGRSGSGHAASGHTDSKESVEPESDAADSYAIKPDDRPVNDADVDIGLSFELDDPLSLEADGASADDDSADLLDFLDDPPEPRSRPRKRRDALYASPDREESIPLRKTSVPEAPEQRGSSRRNSSKTQSANIPSGMIEVPQADSGWGTSRKRFVLVVAGIAVLALGMVLWVVRQQTLDLAETRLAAATDAGLDALAAGNFLEAREQLKIALDALAIVGADEEQIAPLRQRWLEAEFATHLLDGSLIDIVEATRDAERLKREDRLRQFDARFANRWLLLDLSPVELVTVDVKAEDSEVASTETRLLYPWMLDDQAIHVAGVESLVRGNRERVVLAGRLSGSEFDEASQAWVVRMDPDGSFLWTDFSILVRLGFVAEEDDLGLKQILRDQQPASGPPIGISNEELAQSASGADSRETEQP